MIYIKQQKRLDHSESSTNVVLDIGCNDDSQKIVIGKAKWKPDEIFQNESKSNVSLILKFFIFLVIF